MNSDIRTVFDRSKRGSSGSKTGRLQDIGVLPLAIRPPDESPGSIAGQPVGNQMHFFRTETRFRSATRA